MATNKHALVRYKVLDRCFRNPGKKYFIEDLIRECEDVLLEIDSASNGISRRQIFEDIAFMESKEGWSIDLLRIRDGKKAYYRYADISFSINNMPLNEVEINQLKSAIDILSQFKGMSQFEWVHELIPKLNQGIPAKDKAGVVMGFDNNPYLKGIEFISSLYNAILYKRVLLIRYQSFLEDRPSDFEIHPYYLKEYNHRWFLFGYNPQMKKYDWNLALDRIISIKELNNKFNANNKIKWEQYFEDIIGVTKKESAKCEQIVLHFIGTTGKYIETKPIHGSQKSKWIDKNTIEVRLQLIINYELERLILSYADAVKVIKPQSLRKRIKTKLTTGISNFS